MLIDLIPINYLPFVIVWLDWCVYAYWPTLIGWLCILLVHYYATESVYSFSGLSIALFVGFCAWVFSCFINQGYALG